MVHIRLYSSFPSEYSSRGTAYGSNSKIYQDIIGELKQRENKIKEIHLTLYLFNNAHLYNELLKLAEKGIGIVVTSLPLAGYDDRKIKEAENVYEKVIKDHAIDLLIFPHMYMWYGAQYAGGGASYSLHIKAGMITYKNGTSKVFLTSGNLAPGDPSHSETAVFVEAPRNNTFAKAFEDFFNEIEKRAISFSKYNKLVSKLPQELDQVFDFSFVGGTRPVNFTSAQTSRAFFTAPFVLIGGKGSNHYARRRLVKTILSAKRRLLVCAQHCHDIAPFDGYRGQTMIKSIIKARKKNANLDVRVLKQVSSSGLADKRRAAFVESHLYHAGISQRVNRLVHDKFVVADDTIILTTGNFTATQFGWGQRQMEYRTETRKLKIVEQIVRSAKNSFATPKSSIQARMRYPRKGLPRVKVLRDDIFSEVNAFIVIRKHKVANQIAKYFDDIWSHKLSANVEIPM